MAYPVVPSGIAVVVDFLSDHPALSALGHRVATRLSGTYPAVRVSLVTGGALLGEANDSRPIVQVEVWGKDPVTVDTIMRTLVSVVPEMRGQVLAGAYVSGADIDNGPLQSDDDASGLARQLVDLALDVHNP